MLKAVKSNILMLIADLNQKGRIVTVISIFLVF